MARIEKLPSSKRPRFGGWKLLKLLEKKRPSAAASSQQFLYATDTRSKKHQFSSGVTRCTQSKAQDFSSAVILGVTDIETLDFYI